MNRNIKKLEKIDEFTSKLDENTVRFDLVVADIEKAMKRLNECEKSKARYRLDEEERGNQFRICGFYKPKYAVRCSPHQNFQKN